MKYFPNSKSFNNYVWELSNKNYIIVKDLIDEVDIEIVFKEAKLPQQRPSRRILDTCEFTAYNQEFTDVKSFNRVTYY